MPPSSSRALPEKRVPSVPKKHLRAASEAAFARVSSRSYASHLGTLGTLGTLFCILRHTRARARMSANAEMRPKCPICPKPGRTQTEHTDNRGN
jgi:hypothetical protein